MSPAPEPRRSFTCFIHITGRLQVKPSKRNYLTLLWLRAGKTRYDHLTYARSARCSFIHQGIFSYDVPRFLPEDRAVISEVLGRPLPNEAEIERRLAEL